MQSILLMKLQRCPHCRRAMEMIEDLLQQHPEYREIPLKIVDEGEEPVFAESLDYYYVPTFYVAGEKLHEGVPTAATIAEVFQRAWETP